MENFSNALAPLRSAFIQAQSEFILNNYPVASEQTQRYEATTAPLLDEQREILWQLRKDSRTLSGYNQLCINHERLQEIKAELRAAQRILTMSPAMYELAQKIEHKIYRNGKEEAMGYIQALATTAWYKREETISKALTKKGLDLYNLTETELQADPGYQFRMFIRDISGKTANARAILCWGEIKAPHMRFICT